MQKLVSIALCSLAAAAFALPAAAADENTAKARAGSNASVEGGTALGTTGVNAGAGGSVNQNTTGSDPRTGDAQARRDSNTNESKATESNAKPSKRAKREADRDASSGATSKTD